MWVLVLKHCNWRKINYQGSESISHGFSITLRIVAMKQLQLWNMLWEVWENRNWSGDSFQWTALNTSWIFQWRHLIASGLCNGRPLHWAVRQKEKKRERERERKKWPRTCHRGNAKSVQLYRNLSLSWPPSLHLTLVLFFTLSDFSISRDLQGPKG